MTGILVIEHETFWQNYHHVHLRDSGYTPIIVREASPVLFRALKHRIDMVLMGFHTIDALAVSSVREIAESVAFFLPIVVLSTRWPVAYSIRRELFKVGAANILVRPADPAELTNLISTEIEEWTVRQTKQTSYAQFNDATMQTCKLAFCV